MQRRSTDAPARLRNLHLLGRLPGGLRLLLYGATLRPRRRRINQGRAVHGRPAGAIGELACPPVRRVREREARGAPIVVAAEGGFE